jgi:hypothetical protein
MTCPVRVGIVVQVVQMTGAGVTGRKVTGRTSATVFRLNLVGRIGEELTAEGTNVVAFCHRLGRDWGIDLRLFAVPALAARLRVAARPRVQDHYRLDQTAEGYFQLYGHLAGPAP